MVETDLHIPVQTWLEGQGYRVSAEVHHCDLVARPAHSEDPEDIIIVELKTRMSLELVVQAARRKEMTDAVYVAVPVQGSRGTIRNARGVHTLLRRLEVGLLLVRFLRSGTRVEVVLHPRPFTPRRARRRRARIIREIDNRYAELNRAGEPGSVPRMGAWRQRCIHVARILHETGEASPRELRLRGAPPETQQLLARDTYGWFERVSRGVYRLTPEGAHALELHDSTGYPPPP